MASYPRPFWAHEENIEKQLRWLTRKIERGEPLTGPQRAQALRVLKHLRANPENA
jgi:hypothetical protein